MESIRAKKAEKFKELKKKYNEKEFQEWFFKYIPSEVSVNKKEEKEEKEEKEGKTPVKEDKVRPKEKKRKTQRGFKLPTSFQFF
jgi:hypothetical protein